MSQIWWSSLWLAQPFSFCSNQKSIKSVCNDGVLLRPLRHQQWFPPLNLGLKSCEVRWKWTTVLCFWLLANNCNCTSSKSQSLSCEDFRHCTNSNWTWSIHSVVLVQKEISTQKDNRVAETFNYWVYPFVSFCNWNRWFKRGRRIDVGSLQMRLVENSWSLASFFPCYQLTSSSLIICFRKSHADLINKKLWYKLDFFKTFFKLPPWRGNILSEAWPSNQRWPLKKADYLHHRLYRTRENNVDTSDWTRDPPQRVRPCPKWFLLHLARRGMTPLNVLVLKGDTEACLDYLDLRC